MDKKKVARFLGGDSVVGNRQGNSHCHQQNYLTV